MKANDYIQQLNDIKSILEKSTKFKALSGLSGVLAGIYALVGAVIANHLVANSTTPLYFDLLHLDLSSELLTLVLLAATILILSVSTGLYFSMQHAKRHQVPLWNAAAKKLVVNFSVPMMVGGLFVIAALLKGYLTFIAPICLSFYGLALLSAANFTFAETKYLGYGQLVLGGLALFLSGYGLYFWALGFGLFHILYGVVMYKKYEQ